MRETERITDYDSGGYLIQVNDANSDVWANPGRTFEDVRIEVDATKVGGDDDNNFGVICRSETIEDFYTLWISSDGYFAIVKIEDMALEFLHEWDTDDAILQGNTTNRIRADCVGNRLTLYANGTFLGEAEDDSYTAGDVGLEAGTLEIPGTEIRFNNFVVREP